LNNEVKHWSHYETKSYDLRRKFDAGGDCGRANTVQPQKSAAKYNDIFRIPSDGRCSADASATHIFTSALSPAGVFERAVPPADAWNDAGATTREQFAYVSAYNDEHHSLEKDTSDNQ
jgi:hypothetical protein